MNPIRHRNPVVQGPICRLLLAVCLLAGSRAMAQDPELSVRVAQLDNSDYALRQRAMEELSASSPDTLPILAEAYLQGSTERRWRILKVLESMALAGSEADFYRVAATLRVLVPSLFSPDDLRKLVLRWQVGQSDRAVERLRKAGARFEPRLDRFGNEWMGGGFAPGDPRIILGGGQARMAIELEANGLLPTEPRPEEPASEAADGAAAKPLPQTAEEKIRAIRSIAEGDLQFSREIALGSSDGGDGGGAADRGPLDSTPLAINDLGARIVVLNEQGVLAFQDFGDDPGLQRVAAGDMQLQTAVIGQDWQGSADALSDLAAISGLQSVAFRQSPRVTEAQLEVLARIPSLTSLSLVGSQLEQGAVSLLGKLEQLQNLELDLDQVDSGWLDAAVQLPGLMQLRLVSGQGQAMRLDGMQRFSSLRMLSLKGVRLEASDFLELAKLPFLTELELAECQFDCAQALEFRRSVPNLRCTVRGPAFLGVRGSTIDFGDQGCVISEIVPGSAAEKAGLMSGDLIRSIEEFEIDQFETLTVVVSQKKPGEPLRVVVERNGERLQVDAILDDRANAPAR